MGAIDVGVLAFVELDVLEVVVGSQVQDAVGKTTLLDVPRDLAQAITVTEIDLQPMEAASW